MSLFYEPYRRNIKKDHTLSKISNFRSFRNSKYSELLPILTKIERCLATQKVTFLATPASKMGLHPPEAPKLTKKFVNFAHCGFLFIWKRIADFSDCCSIQGMMEKNLVFINFLAFFYLSIYLRL